MGTYTHWVVGQLGKKGGGGRRKKIRKEEKGVVVVGVVVAGVAVAEYNTLPSPPPSLVNVCKQKEHVEQKDTYASRLESTPGSLSFPPIAPFLAARRSASDDMSRCCCSLPAFLSSWFLFLVVVGCWLLVVGCWCCC